MTAKERKHKEDYILNELHNCVKGMLKKPHIPENNVRNASNEDINFYYEQLKGRSMNRCS